MGFERAAVVCKLNEVGKGCADSLQNKLHHETAHVLQIPDAEMCEDGCVETQFATSLGLTRQFETTVLVAASFFLFCTMRMHTCANSGCLCPRLGGMDQCDRPKAMDEVI